jgi:aspartyl-tRNA(Asn)/glutamyl-tRNA(Gln) amidotransferase subunit C
MSETPHIDIDYVANLARIALTDDEKARFSRQLEDVLGYFDRLNRVDVEGVEPTAHAFPVYNVWRDDEPTEPFTADEAMRNAPACRDNQIVMPKVVDDA